MGNTLSVFGVNVSTRKLHFKCQSTHSLLMTKHSTPFSSAMILADLTSSLKETERCTLHTEKHTFQILTPHTVFISIFFGSGGHFVNKVHPGNTLQNSYHWASSTTINLLNILVMKIINKGCQSTADYMPWDNSYVNPVKIEVQKLLILPILIFSALPLPLSIFNMEGRYCCGAFPHLRKEV